MKTNGLTDTILDYAEGLEYGQLTPGAIQAQKNSLTDMLGVMLAATGLDEASKPFAKYAAVSGSGSCTILGRKEKTGPAIAALANGALVHALDFEDSHELATVHPNSAAFPAVMAVCQTGKKVSGRSFITAMALASDICCRLDLGVNEDLLKYGWNMPPIHGCMGAVLGVSRILGLDRKQMADAFTLAMNQVTSSGESANSRGSSMRTVREGFAAQAAVQSAMLAELGTGAAFDSPLEGKLGYYHMYARDGYNPERILKDLGRVFQGEFISFKPWPACRATHTTIEGLQLLMKEHGLKAADILTAEITLQEIGRMVTEPAEAKYRPDSPAIAKFSLPFIAGTVMKYGTVGLDSFTPARLKDPEILALADRVRPVINEAWTKAQNKFTDIKLTTAKGVFTMHLEDPLGSVTHPMKPEDFSAKFVNCVSLAAPEYKDLDTDLVLKLIANLEELEDMNELFSLL